MSLERFEIGMPFKHGHFVPKPAQDGRRLVIADVHGCKKTLWALLEKIALSKNDQLFLLGDYVNKGPDSKGVLNSLILLINEGYSIFPLKGNHEEWWMKSPDKVNFLTGEQQLLLTSLPLYYELDAFFLVHAGFDVRQNDPFAHVPSMMGLRYMEYDARTFQNKTIIHGHTHFPLPIIEHHINKKSPVISLDNGCFYTHELNEGNLLCLNLDTFELIVQENIEYRR